MRFLANTINECILLNVYAVLRKYGFRVASDISQLELSQKMHE